MVSARSTNPPPLPSSQSFRFKPTEQVPSGSLENPVVYSPSPPSISNQILCTTATSPDTSPQPPSLSVAPIPSDDSSCSILSTPPSPKSFSFKTIASVPSVSLPTSENCIASTPLSSKHLHPHRLTFPRQASPNKSPNITSSFSTSAMASIITPTLSPSVPSSNKSYLFPPLSPISLPSALKPIIPPSSSNLEASPSALNAMPSRTSVTSTPVPSKLTVLRSPIHKNNYRSNSTNIHSNSKTQTLIALENEKSFSNSFSSSTNCTFSMPNYIPVSPDMPIPSAPIVNERPMPPLRLLTPINPMSAASPSTSSDPQPAEYNFDSLKYDAACNRKKIPQEWGYCLIAAGMYFFYHGDAYSCPTRSILVQPDMTTEVKL